MAVVTVEHLRRTCGSVVAVNDISFEVEEGEIFGLLGPNGAGKTITVECVEGLRRPDSGTVQVLGLDPQHQGDQLRERIGVQLQRPRGGGRISACVHGVQRIFRWE